MSPEAPTLSVTKPNMSNKEVISSGWSYDLVKGDELKVFVTNGSKFNSISYTIIPEEGKNIASTTETINNPTDTSEFSLKFDNLLEYTI